LAFYRNVTLNETLFFLLDTNFFSFVAFNLYLFVKKRKTRFETIFDK